MTTNIDIQDVLINAQIGLVKHSEIINDKVAATFKKSDDFNTGGNLIVTDRFAIQNNWIPIKKFDTSIFLTSSSG